MIIRYFAILVWALLQLNPAHAALSKSAFSLSSQNNQFLPVEQAFPFSSYQQGNQVYIDWQIQPGYYLYQERLTIQGKQITLGDYTLPQAAPHHDEFMGDVHIYAHPTSIRIPVKEVEKQASITISYQGCAKAGFCYPPETRTIQVAPFNQATASQPANKATNHATSDTPKAQPSTNAPSLTEQLVEHWWTPLLFLILGIGLAFTPCVLPMYPILTSIVLGNRQQNTRRTWTLSVLYVQGMALTYTLLGLLVASAGMQFQAALQQPAILIAISVIFVALAASMFGLYTLQLPSSLQTRLNQLSDGQRGGHGLGVFVMGAISGLVCSPCTTAPLSGALLYVSQTGDLITGAVTLYALSLGMGIPLILVAVFGQKLLPRAGQWMTHVKTLFGFILLAAPLLLLERILPAEWSIGLWSALGIVSFGWLYHVHNSSANKTWQNSMLAIIAIIGIFGSALPILSEVIPFANQPQPNAQETVSKRKIHNLTELKQQLALAKQQGKPVMLDLYADWCVACKEFEKYTFHDGDVIRHLNNFVVLQADVTANTPTDIALLKHLHVLGLPTIDFWNAQGQALPAARISGFKNAERFLQHLQQHSL
ncbi:MAG: protein-disulfide reductase DsbD [Vibrio sp.]